MVAARTIARRVQKTMNKLNDVVRIRNYKVTLSKWKVYSALLDGALFF